MASNRPKLPFQYPIFWHDCLGWLAAREEGEIDITIEGRYTVGTLHNKAKGMRESIRRYSNWPWAIRCMVLDGELHFERRGEQLWAVRKPAPRSIEEVLRDTANILHRGG